MVQRRKDVVFAPIMLAPAMRRLDSTLRAVAPHDVTVTLLGESGTGKEILARRVHELSPRRRGPFVPVNCAAIPESLFESELFGHERGAFTGANARAIGKVEAAEGGTLFLDEIGETPLAMQAKLLRFLENRRFMRVGGTTKVQADVRLVFATLRPLAQDVQEGRFRPDLYYRIQGITLEVPTLRERRADIGPLIGQFVEQISAHHGTIPPRISRQARAALLQHPWPGNVRELRNAIEVVCLLRPGKSVRVVDLPPTIREAPAPRETIGPLNVEGTLDVVVARVIDSTLAAEGGHRGRTAARLGVSLRTIQRHIARGGQGR